MAKKLPEREKQGEIEREKEFILSSVFHARKKDESNGSRIQSRMENQCVDPVKKEEKIEERKKKNCSHHLNIFT
jgi:hypothetical protein